MTENNDAIIKQLKEHNPFYHVSPNPFENKNPDILQLNREASEEIEQLLRDKRRRPSDPSAALILGGTGSGKTHMLTRIFRRMEFYGWPAIFVNVRTFINPGSVMQDLLSAIFSSLEHKNFSGRLQFDMLLEEMMNAYREHRTSDGFTNLEKVDTKIYLTRDMPGINKTFLKALLTYLKIEDEAERLYFLECYREGFDEDDSQKFGLPFRDIVSMSNAERESEAEKIIISLGLVLGYAKVPMIICFDELDSVPEEHKKELITAWGRALRILVNNVAGVLPIALMKPETWNKEFYPVLDDAVIHRLERKIKIVDCSIEQAKQLIRERLTFTFKEDTKAEIDAKYNWLMKRLEPKLKKGSSPRMVLELADLTINQNGMLEINNAAKTLKNTYDEIYNKVKAEAASWPPNADHLTLALEVWLKSHEGFHLSPGDGKTIKFLGSYANKNFMFIIVASKSHFAMSAGLKHGIAFMKANSDGECFYISERKLLKKTYKQANSYLREFEISGGKAVLLDEESRISWYAFTDLINQIDGGDVNIYTSSGTRQAARNDIRELAESLRLLDINFTINPVKPPIDTAQDKISPSITPELDEKRLMNALMRILNASPMKLLAVDKTLNVLAQRGIFVENEKFLSFAKKHPEFRLFQTRTEILIGLTEK